jgi:hypothetical protein
MAREPVVIDFIGLGHGGLMGSGSARGSPIDDERVSSVATRLVRPVPSVAEYHHLASTQAVSRMSPAREGFRNWTDNAATNSPFARPGAAAGDHLISPLPSPSLSLRPSPLQMLVPTKSPQTGDAADPAASVFSRLA